MITVGKIETETAVGHSISVSRPDQMVTDFLPKCPQVLIETLLAEGRKWLIGYVVRFISPPSIIWQFLIFMSTWVLDR